jgi:ribosome-binding factor A
VYRIGSVVPRAVPVNVGVNMKSRKPTRKELLSSCTDVGPDDGVDPRDYFRKSSNRVPNRKALQLCAEVARTLNLVFAACGDDQLRELMVTSVQPAPNASRLLVTVCPPAADSAAEVLEHLQRASGLLRSEVAAATNRRKTPELTFHVAASGEVSG